MRGFIFAAVWIGAFFLYGGYCYERHAAKMNPTLDTTDYALDIASRFMKRVDAWHSSLQVQMYARVHSYFGRTVLDGLLLILPIMGAGLSVFYVAMMYLVMDVPLYCLRAISMEWGFY